MRAAPLPRAGRWLPRRSPIPKPSSCRSRSCSSAPESQATGHRRCREPEHAGPADARRGPPRLDSAACTRRYGGRRGPARHRRPLRRARDRGRAGPERLRQDDALPDRDAPHRADRPDRSRSMACPSRTAPWPSSRTSSATSSRAPARCCSRARSARSCCSGRATWACDPARSRGIGSRVSPPRRRSTTSRTSSTGRRSPSRSASRSGSRWRSRLGLRPPTLILDEPSAGQDHRTRESLHAEVASDPRAREPLPRHPRCRPCIDARGPYPAVRDGRDRRRRSARRGDRRRRALDAAATCDPTSLIEANLAHLHARQPLP